LAWLWRGFGAALARRAIFYLFSVCPKVRTSAKTGYGGDSAVAVVGTLRPIALGKASESADYNKLQDKGIIERVY
jgi:hypothetical protein